MQVVPDLKADTAVEIVKEQIDSTAELTTDDSKTFYKLKQAVGSHKAQVIKPEDLQKDSSMGTYQYSKRKTLTARYAPPTQNYLQYYLNEYCFKFNRRYFGRECSIDWYLPLQITIPISNPEFT